MTTITFHDMNSIGCHVRVNGEWHNLFRTRRPRSADGHIPAHYSWSGRINGIEFKGTTRKMLRTKIERILAAGTEAVQ
jgi:hypothetical protein